MISGYRRADSLNCDAALSSGRLSMEACAFLLIFVCGSFANLARGSQLNLMQGGRITKLGAPSPVGETTRLRKQPISNSIEAREALCSLGSAARAQSQFSSKMLGGDHEARSERLPMLDEGKQPQRRATANIELYPSVTAIYRISSDEPSPFVNSNFTNPWSRVFNRRN